MRRNVEGTLGWGEKITILGDGGNAENDKPLKVNVKKVTVSEIHRYGKEGLII